MHYADTFSHMVNTLRYDDVHIGRLNMMITIKMKKITITLATLALTSLSWAAVPLPDYAPVSQGQQVVINIPQLRLFLFENGKLSKSYPIAVGKNRTQTPLGEYKIGAKAYNPTWTIPRSIQKELAAGGKGGMKSVPPGPNNPLGPVFVRFGAPKLGLGIHGTNAPSSVPGVRSHGCVRMHSPNALEFAKTVNHGADTAVIYQLVSLNADDDHNLWLVAYRDPYNLNNLNKSALTRSMKAWAQANGLQVNQKRAEVVLAQRKGTLICVTCATTTTKVKGELKSLTWVSGKGQLTTPKRVSPTTAPDNEPDTLPEGSGVEVDEELNEKNIPAIRPQQPNQQPAIAPVKTPKATPTIEEKMLDNLL